MLVARFHELIEEGMWAQWLRLELRMELDRHVPRMVWQFEYLNELTVGGLTNNAQAVFQKHLFVFAVEFVAVAMPLADLTLTVGHVSL